MQKANVLILNSDRLAQKSLYELLSSYGYNANTANSIKEALAHLDETAHQIILADIDTGVAGLELLKILRKRRYPADFITLASYGNIEEAMNSVRLGAMDYLVKPVEDKKIINIIEKAMAEVDLAPKRPLYAKKPFVKECSFHGLVGASPSMSEIYTLIDRISNSKATILVRGESGTGKRMIARAIHQADKVRRNKPFIEVSCGALPREVIESELFGHTKGSFTGAINDRKGRFELSDGGTILLDDIDSFSLELQVKLLRVLQQKEFERVGDHKTMKVNVRIVASTNQDLEKLVAEKKFREDLYYRLNVISINIPPLRKRKDDLPSLVGHFVNFYSKENHKKIKNVADETMEALMSYDWPGNIRELENIVERAVILDTDGVIGKDDLPEIILSGRAIFNSEQPVTVTESSDTSSLKDALKEPEKVYILQILEEVGWNKKRAAMKLGVNRTTLYNKLKKYNITF